MLKEFLYVDVTRVRSLLGQLDDGVVEGVVQKHDLTHGGDIGFRAAWLQAKLVGSSSESAEESRSTEDILFTVFEESAESEGIIRTVAPSEIGSESEWMSSEIHGQFTEGEIIRLTNPMSFVDPAFFRARIGRFISMTQQIKGIQAAEHDKAATAIRDAATAELEEQLRGVQRDQRSHAKRLAMAEVDRRIAELTIGVESQFESIGEEIAPVVELVQTFLPSDAISVRFQACGQDRPELAFSGSLLGRAEYIQLERDALFSRYGSVLNGWTSIVQIASIPSESDGVSARQPSFRGIVGSDGSGINRPALEQTLVSVLGMLEATGIAEGPRWPGISVIPLGIYRIVPRSSGEVGTGT